MDVAELYNFVNQNPNMLNALSAQKIKEVEQYRQKQYQLWQQSQMVPTPTLPGFPIQNQPLGGTNYMPTAPKLPAFNQPMGHDNDFSSSSSESEDDNFDYDKAKQIRYGAT